ncbi:MAG: hypothetical protein MJD61_16055 [Proteobacteria bacterium]|nr:hypothetical protein [Pseudomonadota bacterium]
MTGQVRCQLDVPVAPIKRERPEHRNAIALRWSCLLWLGRSSLATLAATTGCDATSPAADPPAAPAGTHAAADASGTPEAGTATEPVLLSQTGLYADIAQRLLAPGVLGYRPRYELWSDATTKDRWILVPAGQPIDARDMDFWSFPVGTKVWKQFSKDGRPLETRMLHKISQGHGGWFRMAFVWLEDGSDATAAPDGSEGVAGTSHDVPSQKRCDECHDGAPDTLLAVGALQLSHDGPGLTLAALVRQRRLSPPPPSAMYAWPGSPIAQAALGMLHANCGHCHNEHHILTFDKTDMVTFLSVRSLANVEQSTTYLSLVARPVSKPLAGLTTRLVPGDPAQSAVYVRMSTRDPLLGMPPIATKQVDLAGLESLRLWIEDLARPGR